MSRLSQIPRPWILPVLLILISFLLYSNTLRNGFIYDDGWAVVEDQSLQDWSSLPAQFLSPRPIKSLTLMIDYHLWGHNPVGYHLSNILLYGLCAAAFYVLVYRLSLNRRVAFLAGLFFALHPIHTEAVANINNRKDVLAALFLMSALLLYIKKGRSILRDTGCLTLYILALLSKEVAAVAFLPLAFLYDLYYRPKPQSEVTPVLKNSLYRLWPFLGVTLIAAGYLLWAAPAFMRPAELLMIPYLENLGTVARAFLKYAQLLLFPFNLNADHVIPPPARFLDLWAFSGIGLLALLIYGAVKSRSHWPMFAFGLWWVILSWLPISNILPIVHYYVAERYFFLPSAGFCLALAVLADRVFQLPSAGVIVRVRAAAFCTVALVLVSFSVGTYLRNRDWSSGLALWSKTVEQSPLSYTAHVNLATAYLNQGSYEKAVSYYQEAIARDLYSSYAHVNLARAYQGMGRPDLAAEALHKALQINPENAIAREHLGKVYRDLGAMMASQERWDEALRLYRQALRFSPQEARIYSQIGDLYRRLGRLDLASDAFQQALALEPTAYSHHDLAVTYMAAGRSEPAIRHLKQAVDLDTEFVLGYYRLAQAEEQAGQFEEALGHYRRFMMLAGEHESSLAEGVQERIRRLDPEARISLSDAEGNH